MFGDDRGERPEKRLHPDPEGDPFLYFAEYPIGTPAALYRRQIVAQSGGFLVGLKRGQEANFHLRLAAHNPSMVMLDEILVWVRMHDGLRITNRAPDKTQVVWSLCDLADHIDRLSGWTQPRREWLAREIIQAARVCFVDGDRAQARSGIQRAHDIFPEIGGQDPFSRRLLSSVLGPQRAEGVVHWLRSFRRRQPETET